MVLGISLLAPALFSQTGIFSPLPSQVTQYMELTADQVRTIVEQNIALQNFRAEKFRRTAQVQLELAQETVKTTIDPMALGLRHMELEAIRRELQAQEEKATAAIQNVLTPAQKTKLQALQQAMRLQPVICEAQAINLLSAQTQSIPNQVIPIPFPGNMMPMPRLDAGAFLFPSVTCGLSNRMGSLSGVILNPLPAQP
jgi:hypothetical protein